MMDLTAEGGPVLTAHVQIDSIDESGKQTYNPKQAQWFPIRDPANLERVNPDYADPADPTRVAEKVKVSGVKFHRTGPINEAILWRHARMHFPDQERRFRTKEEFIAALRNSAMEEMHATIEGRDPPSCQSVKIAAIENASQCASPEEFLALKDQYGGFPADYSPEKQPSLANGRVVCLFAGAKLGSEDDVDAYLEVLGREFGEKVLNDYAANVKKPRTKEEITWAPYCGGNMAQYLNSAFKKRKNDEDGPLVGDRKNANVMFVPLTYGLTDKNGNARQETMLAVVQTHPLSDGAQSRPESGRGYTLDPGGPAPMEVDSPPPYIKREEE